MIVTPDVNVIFIKQSPLACTKFELVTNRTRKREFLEETNLVVPWIELTGLIQPFVIHGFPVQQLINNK
jgi:hypothetical protein